MPKDSTSPFTPGLPVPVEFFAGRRSEVEKLKTKAVSAAAGRLEVGFVVGERGIGKSSLVSFVRYLAEHHDQMLGVHVFLGGVNSLEEMVRRIFERLLKESIGMPWYDKIKGLFGSHIREVGLFGVNVEFKAPEQDLNRLVDGFAPAVRNLVDKLKEEKKGILLILDDINGLASSTEFANWIKSLVDEIATSRKPLPMCLLLVGIEERRQSLIELQPSLARVFELFSINTWSHNETREFFRDTFAKVGIRVEEDAIDFLSQYAGGLPVLAHEIGDAAFNLDTDKRIDRNDALKAVVKAAEIVGRKHIQPQVFQAIGSSKYRSILRKLAKEPFEIHFTRKDVIKQLSAEDGKVFDNFLRRMADLGVVERDGDKGVGAYRFINRLHYVYFWMEAATQKNSR